VRTDGAGEVQRLLDSKGQVVPFSFFPDGRRLAYYQLDPITGWDLWTLPLDVSDPDHPKPYSQSEKRGEGNYQDDLPAELFR
jgi:hypothetical protein